MTQNFSRRRFLKASMLGISAVGIAACVPAQAPGGSAENGSSSTEKVELIYVERGDETTAGLLTDTVNNFNETHPDIEVTFQPVAGNVWEKVQTMYASGRGPDVHYALDSTRDLAAGGLLLNLEPHMEADNFDIEDYYEEHLLNARYDGDLYGLDWAVAPVVVYTNLDLYEAAGVEPLSADYTWDEVLEKAAQLTQGDDVFGWGPEDFIGIIQHIWQAGWDLHADGYTHTNIDNAEVIEAVQFWADLSLEQGLAPTPEQTGGISGVESFQTGRYANYVDGVWQMAGSAKDWEFNWQVAYHPSKSASRGIMWNSYNGINAQTEHPDEAWQFLKDWSSTESQIRYNSTFGYIPGRRSAAAENPWISESEHLSHIDWNVYNTAAENGHRPLNAPRNGEVNDLISNAITQVLSGQETAEAALTAIAADVNELLESGYGV